MKAHFRVKGDQVSNSSVYPFELIRKQWKNQIGKHTFDGDLILDVVDIDNNTIEIQLEMLNENNRKFLNPHGEKISFSMQ
jgi:hypothetical protein